MEAKDLGMSLLCTHFQHRPNGLDNMVIIVLRSDTETR